MSANTLGVSCVSHDHKELALWFDRKSKWCRLSNYTDNRILDDNAMCTYDFCIQGAYCTPDRREGRYRCSTRNKKNCLTLAKIQCKCQPYFSVAGMTPAIFDSLAFSFAMKFLVAGQLFLLETASTSLNSHLPTLKMKLLWFCQVRLAIRLITVPHLPLWHLSAHSWIPHSSNFPQVSPHPPISTVQATVTAFFPQGHVRCNYKMNKEL